MFSTLTLCIRSNSDGKVSDWTDKKKRDSLNDGISNDD